METLTAQEVIDILSKISPDTKVIIRDYNNQFPTEIGHEFKIMTGAEYLEYYEDRYLVPKNVDYKAEALKRFGQEITFIEFSN